MTRATTARSAQWQKIPSEFLQAALVISHVLPFRTNAYVMNELKCATTTDSSIRSRNLSNRRERETIYRCLRWRRGVLLRPSTSRRAAGDAHTARSHHVCTHQLFRLRCRRSVGYELVAHAPTGCSKVYLVSGGSEAVEAALKMARQYFVERGQPERRYFIARHQSYHGNTLGALGIGGNAWRREKFAPLLTPSHYIEPCYPYRFQREDESLHAYGLRAANQLQQKIDQLGAENVIAFVAETVAGATLDRVPAAPGYLRRVREICDRNGILLILDEVMCGMGRTGVMHACAKDGVLPDLMTVAKGLGGGYAPIGATLVSEKIVETIRHGSGSFQHGHTYLAHPLACAAALAVQQVIRRDGLLDKVVAPMTQGSLPLKGIHDHGRSIS